MKAYPELDRLLGFGTKMKSTKAKINKCYYIKLKSFSIAKNTIYKMNRYLMEWKEIFANHIYLIRG